MAKQLAGLAAVKTAEARWDGDAMSRAWCRSRRLARGIRRPWRDGGWRRDKEDDEQRSIGKRKIV
jgi:hypothetical protein